ncbi:MAG: putative inorganic carbon transporter subunit DabA, partial [Fulvivirga sp.]|nr:putative inorganic carbon transporter subunit DabA [Fulvivirga sp.]
LFDGHVSEQYRPAIEKVEKALKQARKSATAERLNIAGSGVEASIRRSTDWAETRPEWGLAKNAGFIIGPRSLTRKLNLQSRCFLHSYNWMMDDDGSALEAIMQGPMVVTQWINNHYYFASVDNEAFGSGSKITQNITGRFGVVQGNGGDLKSGLPLQSLNATDEQIYHQPLRLTVLIHAPKARVASIFNKNEQLESLVTNKWIYLGVINPSDDGVYFYEGRGVWQKEGKTTRHEKQERSTPSKKIKTQGELILDDH